MSNDPLTVGDTARVFTEVRDIDGALADPTGITATVKAPDGTQSAPPVVKDATGKYHFDLDFTQEGTYAFRVEATGSHKATGQGGVYVSPHQF